MAPSKISSCEHLEEHVKLSSLLELVKPDNSCRTCGHKEENWICLSCGECFCGRFVSRHMVDHSLEKYHLVALRGLSFCIESNNSSY
ncbi:unnamed protein product [Oikopleura dioica]|uniref:UBP-type domain-containing protein n=1 Tax=Oikopleura dioica TaxID=34765 RepID=E4XBF3_OIKDI|nr:unnamed protein product [Oikopleura dioica]